MDEHETIIIFFVDFCTIGGETQLRAKAPLTHSHTCFLISLLEVDKCDFGENIYFLVIFAYVGLIEIHKTHKL